MVARPFVRWPTPVFRAIAAYPYQIEIVATLADWVGAWEVCTTTFTTVARDPTTTCTMQAMYRQRYHGYWLEHTTDYGTALHSVTVYRTHATVLQYHRGTSWTIMDNLASTNMYTEKVSRDLCAMIMLYVCIGSEWLRCHIIIAQSWHRTMIWDTWCTCVDHQRPYFTSLNICLYLYTRPL